MEIWNEMNMSVLSDEGKLLFLLSAPIWSPSHDKSVSTILLKKKPIDIQKLYHQAEINEVLGFIHKNSLKFKLFPDSIQVKLSKSYKNISLKNMRLLGRTLFVLRVLSQHGIKTIPLKGAAASEFIFDDFGVYPSSDIDLLVHPSDLLGSKTLLTSKGGFSEIHEISEKDLISEHYHLLLKDNAFLLELHWNLVKRYFNIQPDFWFEGSREKTWSGAKITELAIEKNIIYQIFRIFDHCFFPLRFFTLLCSTIDRNSGQIKWNDLLGFAGRLKMKKLVCFMLVLVADLFNTHIPPEIIHPRPILYPVFKKLVLKGIFSGIVHKHFKMMLYAILVLEPQDLWRILGQRLFPSFAEIRLRYNISPTSKKIIPYYIFNPFLMLFGKSKIR